MTIYHSIVFSFCLMGMASAVVNLCLEETNLQATCTGTTGAQDQCAIKAESPINKEGGKDCKLTLTTLEMKDKAFNVTCTIGGKESGRIAVGKEINVDKVVQCSAGSVPQLAGVTLLLALLTPLLSGVL